MSDFIIMHIFVFDDFLEICSCHEIVGIRVMIYKNVARKIFIFILAEAITIEPKTLII